MENRPQAQKISIFLKRSSNFASNGPSTTCRHKVKVKLCKKNTWSKKLNLGLNFSTSSGGVTSPSLKGSMAQTYKLSQMDIQPGGVQDHFLQNVLKFGFGDWKNVYGIPFLPKISRKLDVWMGKMKKKSI